MIRVRSVVLLSLLASMSFSPSAPAQSPAGEVPVADAIAGVIQRPVAHAPSGPSGIITTYAGNGYLGESGNGGPANQAEIIYPQSVAVDGAGNLYFTDGYGQVIHKVTAATGIISDYAGTGAGGYTGDGGPATSARLDLPVGVAVDAAGNLYIADYLNNVIRKVTVATGIITTVAGNGYGAGNSAFPRVCGIRTDGILATKSSLCGPEGLTVAANGDLYIADSGNEVIRKVTAATGLITTVAGNGSTGYSGDGGLAVNAEFNSPRAPALDKAGNLYIPDDFNCAIRKVTVSTGIVTSYIGQPAPNHGYGGVCGLAGDGGPVAKAQIGAVTQIALDRAGNLFLADSNNYAVREVVKANGKIYTVAGSFASQITFQGTTNYGISGYSGDGGPATHAHLSYVTGVAVDASGNLFVADQNNCLVRKVSFSGTSPVETPVISPQGGNNSAAITVTIQAPIAGSHIHYTLDGSIPTTNSPLYKGPIANVKSAIVTAFAVVPGAPNSDAAVADYFYTPTPVVTLGGKGGGGTTPVTITDDNPAAQIYYTTDGSNPTYPTSHPTLYTGQFSVGSAISINAAALVTIVSPIDGQISGWSADSSAVSTSRR